MSAWERAIADGGACAESYWEALPYWDPDDDHDRSGTHLSLLMKARGEAPIDDDSDEASDDDNIDDATAEMLRAKCGATRPAVKAKPPSGARRC